MAINQLWNKRCGPGGGIRRLHQIIWGRNSFDVRSKDSCFARHCTVVIGLNFISGNVNSASNSGRKPANRNLRAPANGARRGVRKAA